LDAIRRSEEVPPKNASDEIIGKTSDRSLTPILMDLTMGLLSPSTPLIECVNDSSPTDRDTNRNGAAFTLKSAMAVSAENTRATQLTGGAWPGIPRCRLVVLCLSICRAAS
jgi:hypothetical protein